MRTERAKREEDEYDGVKAFIRASVDGNDIKVRVDIGFGAGRARQLAPFLPDDPPASVRAYPPGPVVAEKVQTLLSKSPRIRHRAWPIAEGSHLHESAEPFGIINIGYTDFTSYAYPGGMKLDVITPQ